jgi:hypothetical protein
VPKIVDRATAFMSGVAYENRTNLSSARRPAATPSPSSQPNPAQPVNPTPPGEVAPTRVMPRVENQPTSVAQTPEATPPQPAQAPNRVPTTAETQAQQMQALQTLNPTNTNISAVQNGFVFRSNLIGEAEENAIRELRVPDGYQIQISPSGYVDLETGQQMRKFNLVRIPAQQQIQAVQTPESQFGSGDYQTGSPETNVSGEDLENSITADAILNLNQGVFSLDQDTSNYSPDGKPKIIPSGDGETFDIVYQQSNSRLQNILGGLRLPDGYAIELVPGRDVNSAGVLIRQARLVRR